LTRTASERAAWDSLISPAATWVGKFTLHDLRRSCITNWARQGLPIHVTQKLAGHADINTTQKFYLSVQDDDLNVARRAQQRIVKGLSDVVTTDQN
jgi:integrase